MANTYIRICEICGDEKETNRTMKNYVGKTGISRCLSCSSKGNTHRYKGRVYDKELYNTRIYKSWSNMMTRCHNTKVDSYERYGGRGITVCDRWKEFANFYDDMSPTYSDELTLDRTDNSKGYSPENCKWSTRKEQAMNTRKYLNAIGYTFNGVTKTTSQWAEEMGIKRTTLDMRLRKYNWPLEKALTGKRG